jgi:hypothetical protein
MVEGLRELTAQISSLQEDMSTLISRTEALDREISEEIIPRTEEIWKAVIEESDAQEKVVLRKPRTKFQDKKRLSAHLDVRRLSNHSGTSSAQLSRKWSSLRSLSSMGKRSLSASSLSVLMMNEVKLD